MAIHTMQERITELRERTSKAMLGGGEDRLEKQHKGGKLTARERVEALVDPDSFEESGMFAEHRATLFGMAGKDFPADGVVTGAASVSGRLVHLASQDFTVSGGSAGEVHSIKVAEIMQQSLKTGSPFVFINDSGGARVQEGIDSLSGYGKVFYTNVMLSGAVPQISLICGPCAGGAAYSPALTDFIIQTRQAQMFITGPQVIKGVTGESVTAEQLGGPEAHMANSGVIHFIAEDDRHAVLLAQKLLSFLPSNNLEDPPRVEGDSNVDPDPALDDIVPADNKKGYDVRDVIAKVVDFGDFLEVQSGYAMNIVVGFARIAGRTVGIIANQPSRAGGRAGYQCVEQGVALHPLLQCVQYLAVDVRGRAGIPAGRAAGARRHHPSRRQDAVRLLGGDGSESHGDPAQELRRRVPGDVRQGSGRRPRVRLADRGGRGDGRGGRGRYRVPQRDSGGRGQAGQAGGNDRELSRGFLESLCRRRAAAGGCDYRAFARRGGTWRRCSSTCTRSGNCGRPRSTG